MIVRTAVLEGTVSPEDQQAFDAFMHETVVPAIATYPGILRVSLRKTTQADDGAPPIYMIHDLYFKDVAAMDAALASDVRTQVRELIKQGMSKFEGRVYHLVQDVVE